MKIGVLVYLRDKNVEESIKQVHELGLEYCQLCAWEHSLFTDEVAEIIKSACERYNVTVSTFWCGWSGPAVWNFYEGPATLGIVPREHREYRISELMAGSDFAKKLGVGQMATHVGFIPEQPTDVLYKELIPSLRLIAEHCRNNGQCFMLETGQETPVTLLRTIEELGYDNVGINFDPANLILYGKANPIDALGIVGKYVRDVHAKDGLYPRDGKSLGEERVVGTGAVNYPAFIAKLKEIGYDGTLTVEREISGEQQIEDIKSTIKYLGELIG